MALVIDVVDEANAADVFCDWDEEAGGFAVVMFVNPGEDKDTTTRRIQALREVLDSYSVRHLGD